MLITFKIRKVNDFFDKVLKEVSCKLRKALHKSVESIKNSMKSTKICSKMSPSRKPAPCRNQQINPQYKSTGCMQHNASPKPREVAEQTRVSMIFVIT